MELLAGEQAKTRVAALLTSAAPLAAVEVDPLARQRGAPSVLAFASQAQVLLVDGRSARLLDETLAALDRPLGAFRAKEIHRALLRAGASGARRWACASLSEQLIAGGRPAALELDDLCKRLNLPPAPPAAAGLAELGERARRVAQVVQAQILELKRDELTMVSKIESSAVSAVAELEHHGMPFDAASWRAIEQSGQRERNDLRARLTELFSPVRGKDLFGGVELNLDSDQDLRTALRALGHELPNARRETLATLPAPLGALLVRFRDLGRMVSTYGESFLSHLGDDGRLHPTFEQIGASTGRMACHSPNLQAIVKDSPHRACFRAPAGRSLVTADYSACELRIIAEMSGDPVFHEAFERGEDLHARVATAVFGKPVSKTENPELRHRAKAVNFGLAYGMGAQGLAKAIEVDVDQARKLLDRYFASFPKIRSFLERAAHEGLRRGFARTLAGRRLYLDTGDDAATRGYAERVAKNMPIQGTSADITKLALGRLRSRLGSTRDAFVVNAVHDEIVVECATEHAAATADLVRDEMCAAATQLLKRTPVAVDVSVGAHWAK